MRSFIIFRTLFCWKPINQNYQIFKNFKDNGNFSHDAIGIGFHNFGEGLAVCAAIALGQAALGTFLIIGFALHNTTEGLAIAAPLSNYKSIIPKLVLFGLIAGSPAIFGTWIGGFSFSPFATVIFLSIGAGAIFQVIISLMEYIKTETNTRLSNTYVISGVALGLIIMYFTSIFI